MTRSFGARLQDVPGPLDLRMACLVCSMHDQKSRLVPSRPHMQEVTRLAHGVSCLDIHCLDPRVLGQEAPDGRKKGNSLALRLATSPLPLECDAIDVFSNSIAALQ